MGEVIRIGTRGSQLALWQATQVQDILQKEGCATKIVPIKSEGDLNLQTPLYEMNVQGVFTRYLDAALLKNQIDIAVHSMKDVPTVLAKGIIQLAVLKRGSAKDLCVYKSTTNFLDDRESIATIATGSIRRKAQWLHRYPKHHVVDLRGNVNTRLRKLQEQPWNGAVFAAAGLERIDRRPEKSVELDWMLPAPAQGAIMVVCRETDIAKLNIHSSLNDENTALCTRIERDFLRTLLGGCSSPISAYAYIKNEFLFFEGNVLTTDGKGKVEVKKKIEIEAAQTAGRAAAEELLTKGGKDILEKIRSAKP